MNASPPDMKSPNPRKRVYFDDQGSNASITPTKSCTPPNKFCMQGVPTPPLTDESKQDILPPASSVVGRLDSPTLSSNGSVLGECTGEAVAGVTSVGIPAAKRRKLTVAEKEERKKDKEAKDKEKTEQKVRRDEEKKTREEEKAKREEEREDEKRRRDAEKEEKKQVKEAEKQLKEEEKRRKDDEKSKKDKASSHKGRLMSQMRLNAFFSKPAPSSSLVGEVGELSARASRRQSPSVEGAELVLESGKACPSPLKSIVSDYERSFQTFHLHSHVRLAPQHRFGRDKEGLKYLREKIDRSVKDSKTPSSDIHETERFLDICSLCDIPSSRRRKTGQPRYKTKDIVDMITGSATHPIDLTRSGTQQLTRRPEDLLELIPIKYLQFAEDVRPPYIGTFTKVPSEWSTLRLNRNPFGKSLSSINYDYDSEAEWEEPDPEDGEDLGSEGEEEAGSEDGEDEMEGFLDDEDANEGLAGAGKKRRLVVGHLEPLCSGLCWEDPQGSIHRPGDVGCANVHLEDYKLEVILDTRAPIDPFAVTYWKAPTSSIGLGKDDTIAMKSSCNPMDPPRIPLNTINRTNGGLNSNIVSQLNLVDADGKPFNTTAVTQARPNVTKSNKRPLAAGDLIEFKKAVDGSDLTKAGLVEVLKKRFPQAPKDVIKDTLSSVAQRVGTKEADKRWVLVDVIS
ncbi:MAG: hypothetical protein M1827_000221 [Pycnora praestabilis]|nr:MAG: hypothetical protein M1827_000221 [Pycnora praestabilis]